MGFMFSGIFWGIMLIVIGIAIIIKVFFKVDIPIGRLIFSFFFIYLGISMLIGGFGHKDKSSVIFDESNIEVDIENENDFDPQKMKKEYNVVFGKGTIDLTKIPLTNKSIKLEVNAIFGQGDLYINPDMPIIIHGSAAFASLRFPDGAQVNFGDDTYTTPKFNKDSNYVKIKASTVFGALNIHEKKP